MVRRWQTDLCVVSDENGTMKITNTCVACYRLGCMLVSSFQAAIASLPLRQSHAYIENMCTTHYSLCQDLQTHKPTDIRGWEAADAHSSLCIHSQQAGMHISYLFTGCR